MSKSTTCTDSSNTIKLSKRQGAFISGAVAGACAKTCIAPLDRTKIIFQVSSQTFSLKNAIKHLLSSARSEGIFQLWRGNSATMVRIVPYAALHFTAYEVFKDLLKTEQEQKFLPAFRQLIAGSMAGAFATVITYPLDVARARMAVTNKYIFSNLMIVILATVKGDGILAIWRGLTPSLIGVIPYAGASFYTFETLKRIYYQQFHKDAPQIQKLLFGAVAGLVGQSVSYPLDILRRRMQTAGLEKCSNPKLSMFKTFLYVMRYEGGIRALYKGLSMNWIKGPLTVSISFNTYEFVKNHIS